MAKMKQVFMDFLIVFEPFWGMIQDPNLSTPYQAILNSAMDAKFFEWDLQT